MDLLRLAKSAVARTLRAHRGAQAEVYAADGEGFSMNWADGKMEDFKLSRSRGIGLRILRGERMGFACTTDFSLSSVSDLIARSWANIRVVTRDTFLNLPKVPARKLPELHLVDAKMSRVSSHRKEKLVMEMEARAKNHPLISRVIGSRYSEGKGEAVIASSHGIALQAEGTHCSFGMAVLASKNGETQSGSDFQMRRFFDQISPEKVTDKAVKEAVELFGASSLPSGRYTLLLEPAVACEFLDLVAEGLCADAIQKKASPFLEKKGETVAASMITLVDDGRLADGVASFPFDGEGLPTQRNVLIEDGKLLKFLYDAYTAAKDKTSSTGSASRASYASMPSPGTTNLHLTPGSLSRKAMLSSVDRGIFIREVMGMHNADPVSGDFSVAASGMWIENGEVKYPVRSFTLAGNLIEFLRGVDGVGDDLTFYGSTGSPTLRVRDVAVSGK